MHKNFKVIFLLLGILMAVNLGAVESKQFDWVWPLDGNFIVIKETKYGSTVENTDYGIRNLDLIHSRIGHMTCFNVGWHSIYHAGVDLYMADGNTVDQPVKVVSDGIIKYINNSVQDNQTIIIEHPNYQVWSVYWHLKNVQVNIGDTVSMGDTIGYVTAQPYSGRFPDIHPFGTDDSHLHFEIRTFEDGSTLFPSGSSCNGLIQGAGYTYPNPPDAYGYLDPIQFIRNQMRPPNHIYLPLVLKPSTNFSECQPGQNLLANRGFEEATIEDPAPWIEITTDDSLTSHIVQTNTVFLGARTARFGDWNNISYPLDEELPQSFTIPWGATSAVWEQTIQLIHTSGAPPDPDDVFVFELNNAETGLNLPLNIRKELSGATTDYEGNWHRFTINISDVAPYAGQKISLSYRSLSNANDTATSLLIDDIQFVIYCADLDTFEPNDNFNSAYAINPDKSYTSYIWSTDDVDWYKFDVDVPVNKERLIEVGLENIPANTNYNLAIYDANGNELAMSENSGNNDEGVLVIASQNETYHIKVYPTEGTYSQSDRYKVWVQVGSPVIPKKP